MNEFKTVLVGVDFSASSQAALRQAARIAVENSAALHVLHVIEALAVSDLAEALHVSVEQERKTAVTLTRHELEQWLEPASLPKSAHVEIAIGVPLAEVLARAAAVDADLIVLGAQGANVHPPEVGTLALRVLRKADVNVLLTDSFHTSPFHNIVACVDFSPTSHEVVQLARKLGSQAGSHVDFLHVFHGPWHRLHYKMPSLEAVQDFHGQYQHLLQSQLGNFVGDLHGLNAACVLDESVASQGRAITAYARQIKADLVILGMLGRTHLRQALLGSTAEHLLKELPCSVLAVKPPPELPD